jgi:hypothetical protein
MYGLDSFGSGQGLMTSSYVDGKEISDSMEMFITGWATVIHTVLRMILLNEVSSAILCAYTAVRKHQYRETHGEVFGADKDCEFRAVFWGVLPWKIIGDPHMRG